MICVFYLSFNPDMFLTKVGSKTYVNSNVHAKSSTATTMANSNSESIHYSANSSNSSYQLHQHHFYTNPHNRSDLTLHKVSAIQIALDDNKSPTFSESFDSKMHLAISVASSGNCASSNSINNMAGVGDTSGNSSSSWVSSANGCSYNKSCSANSSTSNLLYRTRTSTPSILFTGPDSNTSQVVGKAVDGSDNDSHLSLMASSSDHNFEESFILTTGGSSSNSIGLEFDHALLLHYGWAILLITWIIVIAGITSMLGLWDKPCASLTSVKTYEKATGYPIQGYYSCLVFMVFIASWVWCTTSWVGMKFFRHTKGGLTKSREATTGAA